ncbi:unnamed protein product, partial [marine sediment metagenome]
AVENDDEYEIINPRTKEVVDKYRAAGLKLWEECRTLGGCRTGEAKLSRGHNLKAKYVIHTVGPVYSGSKSDPEDLRDCYKNSLLLASRNKIKSVSFPSISTGIFGYPVNEASRVALKTITNFLEEHPEIELVRMVLFTEGDYGIYKASLDKILKD